MGPIQNVLLSLYEAIYFAYHVYLYNGVQVDKLDEGGLNKLMSSKRHISSFLFYKV